MVELKRRHHVLPRFYLQGFADRNQVRTTWLPGDKSHLASVNDVSVEKDYYTFSVTIDGQKYVSDYWEDVFSEVEGASAAAFKAIIDDRQWPPSPAMKHDLAWWIALQHMRGNAVRNSHNDLAANIARLQVGASGIATLRHRMESALGREVGDLELEAEWDDLVKEGGPTITLDPGVHLATMDRMVPGAAAMFNASGMGLLRFHQRSLITSDTPVSLIEDENAPWGGVGLATWSMVTVPLARRVGLVLTQAGDECIEMRPSTAAARGINAATAGYARRFVLSHPEDSLEALGVELHAPVAKESQMSNIDGMINRDRKPGTSGGLPSFPTSDHDGRMRIDDFEWPIPGRVFDNPFAPG